MRQLERLAGISLNRVPFRTGPQIMPDLIAGRVHIYVSPTLAVLPLHDSKELKVIGITSPERLREREGHPDARGEEDSVRPLRLARHLRARGNAAADHRRVQSPHRRDRRHARIQELIEKGGSIPEASTPAELGKIIVQTRDEVASTIVEFGLQQD